MLTRRALGLEGPLQRLLKDWAQLQGVHKLLPNGWELHVELRDGDLWADRKPDSMKLLVPLGAYVFARKGALGELIFITDEKGGASKIVDYRKFQPLIWMKPVTVAATRRTVESNSE